jgi:hypothetical protein
VQITLCQAEAALLPILRSLFFVVFTAQRDQGCCPAFGHALEFRQGHSKEVFKETLFETEAERFEVDFHR